MEYSLRQSISDAYDNSDNVNIKTEIFLNVYRKDDLSNNYMKYSKKIMKLMKKIKKYTDIKENDEIIRDCEKEMEDYSKKKDLILEEAITKYTDLFNDKILVSQSLVSRYQRGFTIVDRFKGIENNNSPYGILVLDLFKTITAKSIFKTFSTEKTAYQLLLENEPELKQKEYVSSREGSEKVELNFICYLIDLSTKDYNENEIKKLLDDVVSEVSKTNEVLSKKIKAVYNSTKLTGNFSTTILQVLRLSIGKGAFMNTSVIVTNLILKKIMGKGMTYAQNAVFRKFFARFLGSGPFAIFVNIALFIPDLAAVINRRDYVATINVIFLLYFLRSDLT